MFAFTSKVVGKTVGFFKSQANFPIFAKENYPDLKHTTALGNGNKNPEHQTCTFKEAFQEILASPR